MDKLVAILEEEFEIDFPIDANTRLLSSGLIDSFRIARLLVCLESHYGVRIKLSDIGADNFDTPQQIYDLIEARR